MKKTGYTRLCIFLLASIMLSTCARTSERHFNFSLHNTVSIFLLENEKGFFFCIPIQYLGGFHIGAFEFTGGFIAIGGYEIPLLKDNSSIFVYLNQKTDDSGSLDSGFDLVFGKERGRVLVSRMSEPLSVRHIEDGTYIHYYIFIERFLKDHEVERIKAEYGKGNLHSRFEVWFNIVIDSEAQTGSGVTDSFVLYNGPASDAVFLFPNLNFFRARYL